MTAELKVNHIYSVEAKSEAEAKKFIETKERCIGEWQGTAHIKDKVWLGNNENRIIDIETIWEE